jgi:hypothetical protein
VLGRSACSSTCAPRFGQKRRPELWFAMSVQCPYMALNGIRRVNSWTLARRLAIQRNKRVPQVLTLVPKGDKMSVAFNEKHLDISRTLTVNVS